MSATLASDATTLTTMDSEDMRPDEDHVDVDHAEAQFDHLRRALSKPDYSEGTKTISSQQEKVLKDIETASLAPVVERFDLREYLTSSNDASQAAGIKHKHVGVTWEDLEVLGVGGEDSKVGPLSPSPFPPYLTILSSYTPQHFKAPSGDLSHSPLWFHGGYFQGFFQRNTSQNPRHVRSSTSGSMRLSLTFVVLIPPHL